MGPPPFVLSAVEALPFLIGKKGQPFDGLRRTVLLRRLVGLFPGWIIDIAVRAADIE